MKIIDPVSCRSSRGDCRRLVSVLTEKLVSSNLTIAFGESATGGRVAYEFSLLPGAGLVLKGGIVCYAEEIKTKLLGISDQLIEKYSAESPQASRAIVEGLMPLFPADILVGLTGLVRPGGSETPQKPVGSVFIVVVFQEQWYTRNICVKGPPETIVEHTVVEVCKLLLSLLSASNPEKASLLLHPEA